MKTNGAHVIVCTLCFYLFLYVECHKHVNATFRTKRNCDDRDMEGIELIETTRPRSELSCFRDCLDCERCVSIQMSTTMPGRVCNLYARAENSTATKIDRSSVCIDVRVGGHETLSNNTNMPQQCPPGFTGPNCEHEVDVRCSAHYSMFHDSTSGEASLNNAVRFKDRTGLVFQTRAQFLQGDKLVTEISRDRYHAYSKIKKSGCSQAALTMTKAEPHVFAMNPWAVGSFYTTNGFTNNIAFPLNGSTFVKNSVHSDISLHERYEDERVLQWPSSTIVNDGLDAIQMGYEFNAASTVVFDDESLTIHDTFAHFGFNTDCTAQTPAFFKHHVKILNGRKTSVKVFVTGEIMSVTSSAEDRNSWIYDLCWHSAMSEGSMWTSNSDYLRTALLQGRRARVVCDGVSSKSHVIYIFDDEVIFQLRPYLTPRHSSPNADSLVVHTMASTDGYVITCEHSLTHTTAVNPPDSTHRDVSDIGWFVSSRDWLPMYQTDLSGLWISGDFQELTTALDKTADLHLVISTSEGWSVSLLADQFVLTDDAISAEVVLVLSVDIHSSTWTLASQQSCRMDNYLVSTSHGVSIVRYTMEDAFTITHHDFLHYEGTVTWYISP